MLGLLLTTAHHAQGELPVSGLHVCERCHIHTDGSGYFEVALDLSQAEQLVGMIYLFTAATSESLQEDMQSMSSVLTKGLRRVSGIRDVTVTYDAGALRFKLRFRFSHIRALNEAINKAYTYIDYPGTTHFGLNSRTFTREDTHNVAQLLAHYCRNNGIPIDHWLLKLFLKATTYRVVYSFDKKIKQSTYARASVSEDCSTLQLVQPLLEAYEEALSLSSTVFF